MSLLSTLAKVAVGVAVVKGVGAVMSQRGNQAGTAGDGGLFGGPHSPGGEPQPSSTSGSGLEDILGGILGGQSSGGQQQGGLGGLLEGLSGQTQQGGGTSSGGGLNDMLRDAAAGGGLGGLLGQLTGGQVTAPAANTGKEPGAKPKDSFGEALNQSISNRGEPASAPTADQEAMAALMLKAMIQAAKADGVVDEQERAKLLDKLGDISAEERAFVTAEMQAPVDAKALADQVPNGLAPQVYAMSLVGINLDNRTEAQYLHELATAMGLDRAIVNSIHERMGVAKIYQ